MKKKRNLFILFLIGIFLLLIIATKTKKEEHQVSYSVPKNYQIEESYKKEKKDTYTFEITNQKQTYQFTISGDYSKQKRIIKEIKESKDGTLTCIIPIYTKETKNQMYCNLGNKQVSNYYLIQTKNENYQKIVESLKSYKVIQPSSNQNSTLFQRKNVYNQNIEKEDTFFIWNYKKLLILNHDTNKVQEVLDFDLYDNIMATVVDKYYVLFDNSSVKGIQTIYYYDFQKNRLKKMELLKPLSKNSYINGVVNHLIYVTDQKNKKEYTINIRREEIEEIDQDQTSYIIFQEGEQKEVSKSDFFMKQQLFFESKIEEIDGFFSKDSIYYVQENKFYRVYRKNKKNPILLFEMKDVKDWKVVDEEILILKEDTLYSYTDQTGIREIIESNELKYNFKNIYNLGKK